MRQLITWTEIPVKNLERAKTFYREVLGAAFIDLQIAEFDYAVLDFEGNSSTASLVKGPRYNPSTDGVTIYLNATPDINPVLEKVVKAGGSIVLSKTYLSAEAGFIAFIIDSEGNKIGLQHY